MDYAEAAPAYGDHAGLMTARSEKKTRVEHQPTRAILSAAAAEAKQPIARAASIFDRVPKDVMLQCIGFLDMVTVRAGMHVRTIRKAAGGTEPPSHFFVRELHMPVVRVEAFPRFCCYDAPELVTYVLLWRRHVQTIDASESGWVFHDVVATALQQQILPDKILFPRLTALKLSSRDISLVDADWWNRMLNQCPLLVDLEFKRPNTFATWYMNDYSDWVPRTPRLQPWRAFVVQHVVSPQLYLDLANPHMVALSCVNEHASWEHVSTWTMDQVRQLCAKWGKHGDRVRRLEFGPNLRSQDMDDMAGLLMQHFPELNRSPWSNSNHFVSGETMRAMYGTWAFCTAMPPTWADVRVGTSVAVTKFRGPLQSFVYDRIPFFQAWTWDDVSNVLLQSEALETLSLTVKFPNDAMMDEKLLTAIVTRNPRLQKVWVWPCTPMSDAFLQRLLESCPKLESLRLGLEPRIKCSLSFDTLTWLAERVGEVELDMCIVESITGDQLIALAKIVNTKRQIFQLYVPTEVVQSIVESGASQSIWGRAYASGQSLGSLDISQLLTTSTMLTRSATICVLLRPVPAQAALGLVPAAP